MSTQALVHCKSEEAVDNATIVTTLLFFSCSRNRLFPGHERFRARRALAPLSSISASDFPQRCILPLAVLDVTVFIFGMTN